MNNGIKLKILGDFGPFSRIGKSIGYQVTVGQSSYLIDCGAPLFQQIGGHGLSEMKGLIITHCHDDHKRWFSDLALFHMYAPDISTKLSLITSETVNDELANSSVPALANSLSICRKKVVDIAYENYINLQLIGPRAKYKITSIDKGGGETCLCVTDQDGNIVDSSIAKIIINKKTKRPRMLFKDPDYGEWVEPEQFYPFTSEVFYEKNRNVCTDKEGFTIEAIKAPVWHGIPGIGIKIKTDEEALMFSSDTVNDVELWRELYTEKKVQYHSDISEKEFEHAAVVYGEINDYIERAWSEERYTEAINAFNDTIVVHDLSMRNSVVHTDYERLNNTMLKKDKTILTHSPDRITSEWVLSEAGKTFLIKGNSYCEVVDDDVYPMDADIYHKEAGKYYVGYKKEGGKYKIYEKDGLLNLSLVEGVDPGIPVFNVDLYQDISGKYYPKLDEKDSTYKKRRDGKIEIVKFTDGGSRGKVVKDQGHRKKMLINKKGTSQSLQVIRNIF